MRRSEGGFSRVPEKTSPAAPAKLERWRSALPVWCSTVLIAGLIALAVIFAYCNSFAVPFVYDDLGAVVANRTMRQLWPLWGPLCPPAEGFTVSGRPLLNLSFAMNYALGGLNVWGYHVTNLLIHTAAAWLLFGILRRTFLLPALPRRFGRAATWLALAAALLWALHPLQTESVTYVSQRAESLMGLFYLLTLYCVIRGAGGARSAGVSPAQADAGETPALPVHCEKGDYPPSRRRYARLWCAAAVLACLLGMATKEVMVTAPLMVLLYDRTFLAGSFGEALRRRRALYAGLAATWVLLAYLVHSTGLIGRQDKLGAPGIFSYALSQPGVILRYLRLSLWPSPLCLDYTWPVAGSLGKILPGLIVIAALLAATVWGLLRRPAWGFLGAWFFLILAPSSSILPLEQLAFEHRMYLSLAAVVVLAAAGGYLLRERLLTRTTGERGQSPFSPETVLGGIGLLAAKKGTVPVLAVVVLALACATFARNSDYQSPLSIWQDTVRKSPHSWLAHNNLGLALRGLGKTAEAIEQYRQALELHPGFAEAHINLGFALAELGKTDEAVAQYDQTLRLKPNPDAHNALGAILADSGKTQEAIEHYRQALRLYPDFAEAHNNLTNVLMIVGQTNEAVEHGSEAVRLRPDFAEAHNNLANALTIAGRTSEAIEHYQQAVRLKPHITPSRYNLACLLAAAGRTSEAAAHYRRLLQQEPNSFSALCGLAWLLATRDPAQGGDPAEALRLAERARELDGQGSPRGLDTLAAAYADAGRYSDAVVAAQRAGELARSAGLTALAQQIQSRLELYRAGRPYRE